MGKLDGKTAVVTGASKGIGAEIARHLAAEGAQVVVNYASSQEAAEKVVIDIQRAGGKAVAVRGNVGQQADIQQLVAETVRHYGAIDILVNNAGLYSPAPLGSITEEHFHKHFDLNVLGLILTTQAALPHFPASGGAIVNVGSVVGKFCPPNLAVYNASKAAVDALTRTFARELAAKHIRVNSINPGLIATEGTHDVGFVQPGSDEVPGLGRIGKPADVAKAVVFLASSDSGWISGESLYATGSLI